MDAFLNCIAWAIVTAVSLGIVFIMAYAAYMTIKDSTKDDVIEWLCVAGFVGACAYCLGFCEDYHMTHKDAGQLKPILVVLLLCGCTDLNESRARQAILLCKDRGGLMDMGRFAPFAYCSDGSSFNLNMPENWKKAGVE